jgi:hypothetical protein
MLKIVEKQAHWLAAALLLLFFGRLLATAAQQSATYDEGFHVLQGAFYWQRLPLYSLVQNPPLVNALIGLPVNLALRPVLPPDLGSDVFQNWLPVSRAFMWEINSNGLQILWAGRLAVILLALLLGALVYRWSGRLFGPAAGLLALLLVTFDPNILAHSFLATADLGTAFFLCLAGYLIWRYWHLADRGTMSRKHYLAAGLGIGGLLATKFSGLIILPALGLIMIVRLWFLGQGRPPVRAQPPVRRTIAEVTGWLLIGGLVVLFIYRFQLEPLRVDFVVQQEHQRVGHSAFLFGQVSRTGWWYYFPALFAVKTSLGALALIGLSLFLIIGHCRSRGYGRCPWNWSYLWPLVLAAGIVGAGLTSHVNIGYRHLLPVLPLLYMLAGQLAQPGYLKAPLLRGAVVLALLLLVAESAWIHPYYLAYFNQLVGGPANGWRVAVDSNLDWGQDLQLLAQAQRERSWPVLHASWLGTAPPSAYGIQADFLPGWPWRRPDPLNDDFYPDRPAPGVYALSATQLQGVYLDDPALFRWFRERPPTARVGYSFFIYEVQAEGEPTAVGLSGIGLPVLAAADFDKAFGGNNVRPIWYDARSSFVWPGGGGSRPWLAVGEAHWPQEPALQAFYASPDAIQGERTLGETLWRYRLFPPAGPPSASANYQPPEETAVFGENMQFVGTRLLRAADVTTGQPLALLSYWRVRRPPTTNLQIFVHLLNSKGELVAQHDGLDIQMRRLETGDELVQLHTLALPTGLGAGTYTLRLGLYDPATFGRLPVVTGGETADGLELLTLTLR